MAEQALTNFSHHADDRPVVLIADDSRVVRVSLKNILKNDCKIIEAENGEEAWNVLCENPSVALVFSDLSMPKLDGRGLLRKIRSSESTLIATTPFVVVTGNEESPKIRQELAQLGADEVINKPFDPSKIISFLTSLANRDEEIAHTETDISQQDQGIPQTDFIDGVIDKDEFMESASRELAFAIRNKNELATALIKIDQIDEITQHYSDAAIEHILLTLVEIIRQHIHPDDKLAYFGNGLFAMLRPASNAIGTRYLGRRILEDLASKQFYLGESEQIVSASIGISAPDIKPGTRLLELISLAESRLNTAIAHGGNKVADKGYEKQAMVNLVGGTSELSNQSSSSSTYSQSAASRSASEIQRLAAEQVAEIKAKYGGDLDAEDEISSELIEHKQTIERLTNENRQLINEIGHWKRQSAESDNLRRQLFEMESQQQQLQVKFRAVYDENMILVEQAESSTAHSNTLLQQIETLESENRNLLQKIEAAERENSTILQRAEKVAIENKALLQRIQSLEIENQNLAAELQNNPGNQTQQYIEEENRRLESQLAGLTSRAEKAEVENVRSNQLVNSLKDNIKLLQMQLDQSQQQLTEERQKHQNAGKTIDMGLNGRNHTDAGVNSHLQSSADFSSDTPEPDIELNALPESNLYSAKSEPSSVHLFPEKDQIEAKQHIKNKPAFPPFRVDPEPLLFKEGFHLSSFAIAGIIFIIMLIMGGAYLYTAFNDKAAVSETAESTVTDSRSENDLALPPLDTRAVSSNIVQGAESSPAGATPAAGIVDVENSAVSEQLRLEKESTLRKLAEEEFNRKFQSTR